MLPLVPLYLAGATLRWTGVRPKRLGRPVVSVGNLSAGGTGKTPFVVALAKLLGADGMDADVLSRGYGRADSGPQRVDPDGSAEQFGDEPLLIAREARVPVFVARKRFDAGSLAERETRTLIHVLDDGFQHRQLYREVDIVLVNAEDLADHVLPAGNLREPLAALRRASVFAVEAGDGAALQQLRGLGLKQPIWRFRREMEVPEVAGPVVAFCGIARPEQFFAGLEASGIVLAARKSFGDHHRFMAQDGELLLELVRQNKATALVTTEKDRVRLYGEVLAKLESTVPLVTASLRIVLQDEASVVEWLRSELEL
jgi:tetraacyldisaccharide 4'-kinase